MVAPRRRLRNPLDRYPEELVLWVYDDNQGSPVRAAREALGLPQDTMARALWRSMVAMEHAVNTMTVRCKRRLYLLMRQLTSAEQDQAVWEAERGMVYTVDRASAAADYFLPEAGMTLGQLAVFHILLTRTAHARAGDLGEAVLAVYERHPDTLAQQPMHIDTEAGGRLVYDAQRMVLEVQGTSSLAWQ